MSGKSDLIVLHEAICIRSQSSTVHYRPPSIFKQLTVKLIGTHIIIWRPGQRINAKLGIVYYLVSQSPVDQSKQVYSDGRRQLHGHNLVFVRTNIVKQRADIFFHVKKKKNDRAVERSCSITYELRCEYVDPPIWGNWWRDLSSGVKSWRLRRNSTAVGKRIVLYPISNKAGQDNVVRLHVFKRILAGLCSHKLAWQGNDSNKLTKPFRFYLCPGFWSIILSKFSNLECEICTVAYMFRNIAYSKLETKNMPRFRRWVNTCMQPMQIRVYANLATDGI